MTNFESPAADLQLPASFLIKNIAVSLSDKLDSHAMAAHRDSPQQLQGRTNQEGEHQLIYVNSI